MTCNAIWQGGPLLPKIAPCVLKRELQFSNNPDLPPNFLLTPTTKSTVHVDTDHVSICLQSRPPPTLICQSITKELAQHRMLPQILLGAMFA